MNKLNSMLFKKQMVEHMLETRLELDKKRNEYPFHVSDDDERERLIVPLKPRPRKKLRAGFEDNME